MRRAIEWRIIRFVCHTIRLNLTVRIRLERGRKKITQVSTNLSQKVDLKRGASGKCWPNCKQNNRIIGRTEKITPPVKSVMEDRLEQKNCDGSQNIFQQHVVTCRKKTKGQKKIAFLIDQQKNLRLKLRGVNSVLKRSASLQSVIAIFAELRYRKYSNEFYLYELWISENVCTSII